MTTIYRIFDGIDEAKRSLNELAQAGLPENRVGLLTGKSDGDNSLLPIELPGLGSVSANRAMRDMLIAAGKANGNGARGMLMHLGVPQSEVDRCVEAIKRGAVLEAIVVDDKEAADARAIMDRGARSAARDLERLEEIIVPVIQEQLQVGTREIDAGGVRIASRVRQVPVERTITIHEERVMVERRIVDRPIGETDDAFRELTFDLSATSELPVVTKRAHVVEEIRVHRDRTERVEKITDTLRHTDVKLSEIPGERTFDASPYQGHFAKFFGGRYDFKTVAPAYEFGEQLARGTEGGDWAAAEPEAMASWERHNPGTWDHFKEAILAGFHRLRH